ncbi:hypothetical protein EDB81DRAFT_890865 [Dactylonectria macrodidyma]|uniref:Uncharacterized protein n=1 Tax=Dactylonectria macrodidyma TaxID=307937 RepID=A0A9P9IL40_9HYPO|nr:hypothetical protein EDB81DRAFT_890865 [Dactylonectria macrodidyma]
MEALGKHKQLRSLQTGDILSSQLPSGVDWHDDHAFITLTMLRLVRASTNPTEKSRLAFRKSSIALEQVSLIITSDNTIITLFKNSAADVDNLILKMLNSSTILRQSCDASMLGQVIINIIIDMAILVQTAHWDIISSIEMDVLGRPSFEQTEDIYSIWSETAKLRNIIKPIANTIHAMCYHRSVTARGKMTECLRHPVKGVIITPLASLHLAGAIGRCLVIDDNLSYMTEATERLMDLVFHHAIAGYRVEELTRFTAVGALFLVTTFLTKHSYHRLSHLRAAGIAIVGTVLILQGYIICGLLTLVFRARYIPSAMKQIMDQTAMFLKQFNRKEAPATLR